MNVDKRQLIAGLVGDERDLYNTSAHFYHTVNGLADLLGVLVEGLALKSEQNQSDIHAAYLAALKASPVLGKRADGGWA